MRYFLSQAPHSKFCFAASVKHGVLRAKFNGKTPVDHLKLFGNACQKENEHPEFNTSHSLHGHRIQSTSFAGVGITAVVKFQRNACSSLKDVFM